MVQRGTNEAIDNQVVEGEEQSASRQRSQDAVRGSRLSLSDCQHAHRDEWTILATVVLLSVRTAWHVAGHRGYIAHLGNR